MTSTQTHVASQPPAPGLAIIGCGAVIEEVYGIALNAAVEAGSPLFFLDHCPERAQFLAARYRNSRAVTSMSAITKAAAHAIVATPPSSHYSVCTELLDAGIHVFCEKPFVLHPPEGEVLVKKAQQSGLKLQVNQTRRWFPASIAARKMIAEGALGQILSISSKYGNRFDWPARTAFHSQAGLTRNGILSDQGSHLFDLIRWITGSELETVAVEHDGYCGPETTARVTFSTGTTPCVAVMTWLLTIPSQLRFIGSVGTLVLDDDCNRALLYRGSEVTEVSGTRSYQSYQEIIGDIIHGFLSGSELPSTAWASTVLPSVSFLDRAYTIGRSTWPLITAVGLCYLFFLVFERHTLRLRRFLSKHFINRPESTIRE